MFCFRSFLGLLATGINNFCLAILFIRSIKITRTNCVLGAGEWYDGGEEKHLSLPGGDWH